MLPLAATSKTKRALILVAEARTVAVNKVSPKDAEMFGVGNATPPVGNRDNSNCTSTMSGHTFNCIAALVFDILESSRFPLLSRQKR